MRAIKLLGALRFFLGALSVLAAGELEAQVTSPSSKMPLQRSLNQYGQSLSVYFTIEYQGYPDGLKLPMIDRSVGPTAPVTTSDELVALVRKWLPDADVFVDDSIKDVIHIREKVLEKDASYVMDRRVSLQFKGTIGALLTNISTEQGGTFVRDTSQPTNSPPFDPSVPAQVDQKDTPLRNALSGAIPQGTNHILWTCFVVSDHGHSISYFKVSPSSPVAKVTTAPKTESKAPPQ